MSKYGCFFTVVFGGIGAGGPRKYNPRNLRAIANEPKYVYDVANTVASTKNLHAEYCIGSFHQKHIPSSFRFQRKLSSDRHEDLKLPKLQTVLGGMPALSS